MERLTLTEMIFDFGECGGMDVEELLVRMESVVKDARDHFGDDLVSIKFVNFRRTRGMCFLKAKFLESEKAYEARKQQVKESQERRKNQEIAAARKTLEKYGAL